MSRRKSNAGANQRIKRNANRGALNQSSKWQCDQPPKSLIYVTYDPVYRARKGKGKL
jgi:hypothetical protein